MDNYTQLAIEHLEDLALAFGLSPSYTDRIAALKEQLIARTRDMA